MSSDLRDAARLALQHLTGGTPSAQQVIDTLVAALAVQPQGEPVAWMGDGTFISHAVRQTAKPTFAARYPTPLYTAPQPARVPQPVLPNGYHIVEMRDGRSINSWPLARRDAVVTALAAAGVTVADGGAK